MLLYPSIHSDDSVCLVCELSRWQPEETRVCSGLSLNMTRWQLEEVEKAIGRFGCLYVWIDRVAVPQQESELQRTLLSRSPPIIIFACYSSLGALPRARLLRVSGDSRQNTRRLPRCRACGKHFRCCFASFSLPPPVRDSLPCSRKYRSNYLRRMMAIYAASKITLALRSLESEGNRYHQRAW